MAIHEITLPELGEGIEEGDVVAILVSEGDRIEKEQPIIEVESEKATIEIPSLFSGVVKEIFVKEGDRVKVGQKILALEIEAKRTEEGAEAEPTGSEGEPETLAGEEDTREGRTATGNDETEKAPLDTRREKTESVMPAGPGVRRLARELGLDLHTVEGSGPGGRIRPEDVKEAARRLLSEQPPRPDDREGTETPRRMSTGEQPPLPDLSKWGEIDREPLSTLRRMATRATRTSWRLIPHVTQFDHADITELEEQRKALADPLRGEGVKLTLTALTVKAAALALRRFPRFNASLDEEAETVIHRKYVHIGVAVDTDRGLVVPVVRNADAKPLKEVAREIAELAEKARAKQLKPDEMSGATFNVTNLGGLGTTYFTPIVTWPQVAVLGVGRAEVKPVFRNSRFVPRCILPLVVSYDHRLIDGADAARFLRWIATSLEQPLRLLLEE